MKKFTCILLSLLIFSTPILAQNPCEDSTYLELKKKKLEDMTDREYEYFTRKDKDCTSFLNDNPKLDEVKKASIDYAVGKIFLNILAIGFLIYWLYDPDSPMNRI